MVDKEIAVIILNYMTWQQTIKEVENLINVLDSCQYDIIVVDNCSPNDSLKQLEVNNNDRYILMKSDSNKGYAAGNNIAIRYAKEAGYKYSLILNNDVEITDSHMLNKLVDIMNKSEDIAVVSPDIYAPDGYLYNRDSVRPNVFYMTVGAFLYKKAGRQLNGGEDNLWGYVYRPQGCCMLLDNSVMEQIGYMDEYTFLYCEENILAEMLLNKGYRCVCAVNTSVVHNHSYTTKSVLSKKKFIDTNLRSFSYYLKKYRRFGCLKRMICQGFFVLKLYMTKQI